MSHILTFSLFEAFSLANGSVRIYHGTLSEEDAKSMLRTGWDESQIRGVKAEGPGMGAFFSPEEVIYGKWTVEFEIPVNEFRNYIVLNTKPNKWSRDVSAGKTCPDMLELARAIHGKVETVEEQIIRINGSLNVVPDVWQWGSREIDLGKIKGWATCWRFDERMTLHLRDPSIAKPVGYFKNT